MQAAVAC